MVVELGTFKIEYRCENNHIEGLYSLGDCEVQVVGPNAGFLLSQIQRLITNEIKRPVSAGEVCFSPVAELTDNKAIVVLVSAAATSLSAKETLRLLRWLRKPYEQAFECPAGIQ